MAKGWLHPRPRALPRAEALGEAHAFLDDDARRCAALRELGGPEAQHAAFDVAEALNYLMDLRLKAGLNAIALNHLDTEEPNQLDLKELSTLERDLLKDALQVVKRFKGVIRFHFHLNS
mgnify:CR=1 FL=1